MLMELKSYLAERGRASLTEIALHFSTEPDAVRPMLGQWLRKGKVRRLESAKCGGCASCAPEDVEIYEWLPPKVDTQA